MITVNRCYKISTEIHTQVLMEILKVTFIGLITYFMFCNPEKDYSISFSFVIHMKILISQVFFPGWSFKLYFFAAVT